MMSKTNNKAKYINTLPRMQIIQEDDTNYTLHTVYVAGVRKNKNQTNYLCQRQTQVILLSHLAEHA